VGESLSLFDMTYTGAYTYLCPILVITRPQAPGQQGAPLNCHPGPVCDEVEIDRWASQSTIGNCFNGALPDQTVPDHVDMLTTVPAVTRLRYTR